MFAKLEANKELQEYSIIVSYLEIYNEIIRDLLTIEDKAIDIREDPIKGT